MTDFKEGFAGHVLNTRMRLMHELKEFVDHSLEEFPVVAEKPWILAHDIPTQYARWRHKGILHWELIHLKA